MITKEQVAEALAHYTSAHPLAIIINQLLKENGDLRYQLVSLKSLSRDPDVVQSARETLRRLQ